MLHGFVAGVAWPPVLRGLGQGVALRGAAGGGVVGGAASAARRCGWRRVCAARAMAVCCVALPCAARPCRWHCIALHCIAGPLCQWRCNARCCPWGGFVGAALSGAEGLSVARRCRMGGGGIPEHGAVRAVHDAEIPGFAVACEVAAVTGAAKFLVCRRLFGFQGRVGTRRTLRDSMVAGPVLRGVVGGAVLSVGVGILCA